MAGAPLDGKPDLFPLPYIEQNHDIEPQAVVKPPKEPELSTLEQEE